VRLRRRVPAAWLNVLYPALDIRSDDVDLLYALLDDFEATAIEERDDGVRAFFASAAARDDAARSLAARLAVSPIEVPDEDWARRSQANLRPVTVGRLTVHPVAPNPESPIPDPDSIFITPSTGFGTGHHATTRLCLAAMQEIGVAGASVLDVGTGSGILAIAAARLGASSAIGLDNDPDALQAARENLSLNPLAPGVRFELADLNTAALPHADIVIANLTGALLVKSAPALLRALDREGTLIVSGLLTIERDEVVKAFGVLGGLGAFGQTAVIWERREDEWAALAVKKS
jgi:ribosomal protein L11 methyltransferase